MNSGSADSSATKHALINRVLAGRNDLTEPAPTTAVVLSHAGDEAISLVTMLEHLHSAQFIYVADSPPVLKTGIQPGLFFDAQSAPAARKAELRAALMLAGISGQRITLLGLKESEVSWHIVWLAHRLTALFSVMKPDVVITHPYEGGHPDHDATAMAVHASRARLQCARLPVPLIIEAAAYHRGPRGSIAFGQFLPSDGSERHKAHSRILGDPEHELRRRLLSCYSEHRRILGRVDSAVEAYREAPCYDFSTPPHPGCLLYEDLLPGSTGAHWRILARAAADRLDLPLCQDTTARPAA